MKRYQCVALLFCVNVPWKLILFARITNMGGSDNPKGLILYCRSIQLHQTTVTVIKDKSSYLDNRLTAHKMLSFPFSGIESNIAGNSWANQALNKNGTRS